MSSLLNMFYQEGVASVQDNTQIMKLNSVIWNWNFSPLPAQTCFRLGSLRWESGCCWLPFLFCLFCPSHLLFVTLTESGLEACKGQKSFAWWWDAFTWHRCPLEGRCVALVGRFLGVLLPTSPWAPLVQQVCPAGCPCSCAPPPAGYPHPPDHAVSGSCLFKAMPCRLSSMGSELVRGKGEPLLLRR